MSLSPGARLGAYEILELLGTGGMGDVYKARDHRLAREVAVKVLHAAGTADARARLWREARAAASVNHPSVCQVYEVGEVGEQIFIAMELLDGQSLASRIASGTLAVAEAAQIGLGVLGVLEMLHRRGIVHRDLKPSNVFLTSYGVKVLDFGLARALRSGAGDDLTETQPGGIVGTPRYMAPEQWQGAAPDPRMDLFALGALLFEMLTAKAAFPSTNVAEAYHAVMTTQPPALGGSPAVVALDGVIHRALEKRPDDRYAGAAQMAEDLRAVLAGTDPGAQTPARATTRLVVLPFRMLRPDADVDFLSFSLPDAVTASLAGLESLVVRSTLTGMKYSEPLDLSQMATELGVDAVVSGTLLRAGDQLRVNAQLLEVPAGTILWSRNVQVALGDIFQVQDELAAAIVQSLAIPLSSREKRQLRRDLPASARAYEFYLRANQIGYDPAMLTVAEGLYRSALEEDPNYAPAWARLGRIHRVLAKYGTESADVVNENLEQAEAAFRRALDLNADLSLAHNLYTNFEVETLGRPMDAMVRLLDRAGSSGTDPELFAGLVLACRYCGLLEPSIAADRQARRLDPSIRTSVTYTHFMLGDWERAIATDIDDAHFTTKYAMPLVGRPAEEVIAACLEVEGRALPPIMHLIVKSLRFALERNRDSCIDASRQLIDRQFDPEGVFFGARNVAYVGGAPDFALDTLEQVVERGFYCAPIFRRDPWLDSLRTHARFGEIIRSAEVLSREAEEAYRRVGGERLLGPVS